ncbi:MAG TPA: HDOD domain-containing protein [Ignavibacteriales bacterium]|nr:HDOD domain-containing protein [Ignavibacteriales bacterium]HOL82099.1 HDOD domain-containing protein [Ignavibacteriales bacterium]HOM65095.1 HDOD domain-containing protein [Ignavibacteriales bacterium]HPD68224.1 HDOD domain-containing protein [Ignavibacteriales bacterium]HPP34321.1 HDOD domain-containing protein [Ignavibacteriales bacterium]
MMSDPATIAKKREKTELILSNVYNLPSIPKVMMEVSELLAKPTTTTAELSKVISQDQGLVTKILSIANSPLYGLPRKVSTIEFAILILGYGDIKNIVTALSMIESFKIKSDKNLDQKKFWAHSVITGVAAKRVAEDLGYRIGGEAFIAGLLHDLGITVIHKFFHTAFEQICKDVETNGWTYYEAELENLGLTHREIGKFLAEKWNLPPSLVDTVLNHETPEKATENRVLTAVVHLADYMTNRLGIGDFAWDKDLQIEKSVLEIFKIQDEVQLDKFIEDYKDIFVKQYESLKIT